MLLAAQRFPQMRDLVEIDHLVSTFLWRARDLGIPLFLVNARLSDRSYRGYKRFGFLFRPLFASFAGVGAQNEGDAARLRELGAKQDYRIRESVPYGRGGWELKVGYTKLPDGGSCAKTCHETRTYNNKTMTSALPKP